VTNGRIIGVSNLPTLEQASGVWDIDELAIARSTNTWPRDVPSVVQNADVWLDAADTSTIAEASGAVSQWNNKGSLGNFTQGTAALQPTTGATTLNGLNVIDFAGDYLVSADSAATYKFMHDGTDYIIAAVVKMGNTADPDAFLALCATSDTVSANTGAFFSLDDNSPTRNNNFLSLLTRGVNGAQTIVARVGNDQFIANTTTLYSALLDPDNGTAADRIEQYIDNGSAIKTNTVTNAPSTSNPKTTLQIGAADGGSLLSGYIAELIIISGANATGANRTIVHDYLNEKWQVY